MARVTVKDLRAEARRRLLHCGNGKTISRMNKRELLEFLSCIDHPDADDLGGEGAKDTSMVVLHNIHINGPTPTQRALPTVRFQST